MTTKDFKKGTLNIRVSVILSLYERKWKIRCECRAWKTHKWWPMITERVPQEFIDETIAEAKAEVCNFKTEYCND